METNFCNKCGKCCNNIVVDCNKNIMFFDGIQKLDNGFKDMLIPIKTDDNIITYRCKYLKNNLCSNFDKPEICKNYPSKAFAYIPEDCGYYGYIFLKTEKIKQKVRSLKEEIIHYESLILQTQIKSEKEQYQRLIKTHKNYIESFSQYGSDDW